MISDVETVTTSLMTMEKDRWKETVWRSPGKGAESREFWETLSALLPGGNQRVPALFPKTLYELAKNFSSGKADGRILKNFTFPQEWAGNAAIRSCFTEYALNVPEIQQELLTFGRVFYGMDMTGVFDE